MCSEFIKTYRQNIPGFVGGIFFLLGWAGLADRTHLMLISNLKSEFQKNLKPKHSIFVRLYSHRNFYQNKIKIFFSCSAPSNYPEKSVERKKFAPKNQLQKKEKNSNF